MRNGGGPDRRYSENPELAVVEIAELRLDGRGGEKLRFLGTDTVELARWLRGRGDR